jgi:hypothetical protein
MHQQIGGSPNDIATNMSAILEALSGINIAAIAPSYHHPHVRVLVQHEDFDAAFGLLHAAGLEPTVHSAVTFGLSNQPKALKNALDRLEKKGYDVESVLVVPGDFGPNKVGVSIGISQGDAADWSHAKADALGAEVGAG